MCLRYYCSVCRPDYKKIMCPRPVLSTSFIIISRITEINPPKVTYSDFAILPSSFSSSNVLYTRSLPNRRRLSNCTISQLRKTLSDYPPRNEIDAIKIAGRTIMRTASSCFRNKVYKHSYTTIAPPPANPFSFQSQSGRKIMLVQ